MKFIEVFERLKSIFVKVLNDTSIKLDENTICSTIKDWDLVKSDMIYEIQKEYRIEFYMGDIDRCIYVGDIVQEILNYVDFKDNYNMDEISLEEIKHSEFSMWNETSNVQKRLYWLNQKNPEALDYNVTFVSKIDGDLQYNKFECAIKKSIDCHPMLNAKFQ